jgi:cell fate regulator YaaT (PSP1 superfamily)
MEKIAGVRLSTAAELTYCSPGEIDLKIGDYVIISTNRGERVGRVVLTPDQVMAGSTSGPIRVIERLATEDDISREHQAKDKAKEEISRAQAYAARINSKIRVASLNYDLAGNYLDIKYTAPDQQHRREGDLFKVFSKNYSESINLSKVGDRDRAKETGAFGVCGRELCCSSWMTTFPSISIKLAKDQGLAPNPSKISGVCGRLLCCLTFEVDAYREIAGTLPKVGKTISTPAGKAKILSINYLSETVRLHFKDTGEIIQISVAELRSQMGTTVRPIELDSKVEAAVRIEDEERQKNLLAVLTPVDTPPEKESDPSHKQPEKRKQDKNKSRSRRSTTTSKSSSSQIARRRPAGTKAEKTSSEEKNSPQTKNRRRGKRGGRRRNPESESSRTD